MFRNCVISKQIKVVVYLRLSHLFFRINVSSEFKKIQEASDLVDITFSCDGKQFGAHKLVLFACSPYFREILKVRQFNEIFVCELSFVYR